jgi:hypothetical protein
LSKYSKASYQLFRTKLVNVNRNQSHKISDKYSLKKSANKKTVDVLVLNNDLDY